MVYLGREATWKRLGGGVVLGLALVVRLVVAVPTINVIYDSLCIDSQFFIALSLGNAVAHPEILSLVDINLIPGGQCTESQEEPDKYIFNCPRGPKENNGNLL